METITRLILLILVSYRVSELISVDDGPYDIFLRLRAWSGRKAAQGSEFWSNVANLIRCPFCVGIWVSLLISPLYFFHSTFTDFMVLAVGIAGAQCFLEGLHHRGI